MSEQQLNLWFQIVQESEKDQIEVALIKQPDWIDFRQPPLMHTAIFVVIKQREDDEAAEIVEMMIRRGANVNAINQLGQTALFYTAAHNKLRVCMLLLANGVNNELKDDFGQTAREYAKALGHNSIMLAMDEHFQSSRKSILVSQASPQPGPPFGKSSAEQKLTYRLCKLSISGRVINLAGEQMKKLQAVKPELVGFLRNPSKVPEESFLPRQNWRVLGLKIIDKLWQLSDSFWFQHNSQVWKLPNMEPDVPGLDLEIIRMKLAHQMYSHPKELRIDIKNIWANCKQRLGSDHEMTRSALSLCNHFEHFADKYAYNAYLKA